jgi:hypothetical protein
MTPYVRSNQFATWSNSVADTLAVQVGDVLAKITSGTYSGKVGPVDLTATDGRQTVANIVGVSAVRVSAVDSTGVQERFLGNQDNRLATYYTRVDAADANNAYLTDSDGVRRNLNAQTTSTTVKNQLATKMHNFIN